MFRRLLAGVLVATTSWVAVPVALMHASSPAGASPPIAVQQCKNGAWRTLTNTSGSTFANQGQCISYRILHPISLADLAGSFTGTTTIFFPGCLPGLGQSFDAVYPGSADVGNVTVHVVACIAANQTWSGTFTITTNVGSLSGSDVGPFVSRASPSGCLFNEEFIFDQLLTVNTGTGSFAGATGTLHFSTIWPDCSAGSSSSTIQGTVTVP